MNAEMTPIGGGAEFIPPTPSIGEHQSNNLEVNPDRYVAPSPARIEQAPVGPVVPTLPTVAPPTQALQQVTTTTDPSTIVGSTPTVASDDDLIEKEWVDKLKSIIALTEGSPHEKARVIVQLKADYLKKRWNRTLGQSDV